MSDYIRSTRECALSALRPEWAAALRRRLEREAWSDLEAEVLMCCETTSTKPKKGLFGKAEVILTAMLVTPRWLVWATGREGESPAAVLVPLCDLQVQDYEQSDLHRLMPDAGLNINGLPTPVEGERGSVFLGLGPEPAAQKFREILRAALEQA